VIAFRVCRVGKSDPPQRLRSEFGGVAHAHRNHYNVAMTITLTPEQQKRLEAEVAAGRFASVEEAVRLAVADFLQPLDNEDLSWVKPYLDEAREQVTRGEFVTLEEFNASVEKRLKALG
jgi:Arc/MetJ-type ribon-helix-helix transcriptional regulator